MIKKSMNKIYFDIANSAQKVFEEVYFHQIKYLKRSQNLKILLFQVVVR